LLISSPIFCVSIGRAIYAPTSKFLSHGELIFSFESYTFDFGISILFISEFPKQTIITYSNEPLVLDANSVLLSHNERGRECSGINCSFFELNYAEQGTEIPYRALSYIRRGPEHTGMPERSRILIVNHESLVTQNLYSIPRQIRRQNDEIMP
jgi:hypothetical protein